jgi:hypothetical protein
MPLLGYGEPQRHWWSGGVGTRADRQGELTDGDPPVVVWLALTMQPRAGKTDLDHSAASRVTEKLKYLQQ